MVWMTLARPIRFAAPLSRRPPNAIRAIWKEKASLCLNTGPLLRPRHGIPKTVNSTISTSPWGMPANHLSSIGKSCYR